jgi:hypothetical protein
VPPLPPTYLNSMGIFNWIAKVNEKLPSINGKSSLPTKFPSM